MSLHSEVDRLLDWARVRCPGVSDAGAKQVFYQVANEFFNDTSMWSAVVSFKTIVNVQSYQLLPPPPGQPIRLVVVFDENNVTWRAGMPLGYVTMPNTNPPVVSAIPAEIGTVQLHDAPSTSDKTLFAQFIMNVTLPNDGNDLPEMPDWVLPQWNTVFMDGTCGYLMTQSKKQYTDLINGQYHLKKFRDGISRARVAAMRMNTQGSQNWLYPQDFRSRSQKGGISVGHSFF